MESESGFLEVGNANLFYEVAGEGQPIVMIHAGVADSRQWNDEFAQLAQDFRVLRYDMRGYGRSEPAEGKYTNLNDLRALLDHLGFRQPVVAIGCSMGGTLAMDLALAEPERVKALVMVDSGPSGLRLDVPDHPSAAAAEEAYEAGDLDRLAELEAQIWFDGIERRPEDVDPRMRKLALEMNRLALAHDARNLGERLADAETPAVERLNDVKMPVLVILGENDVPFMQAAADLMVQKIPSARKVVIEDAAHLPNLEHPEQFEQILRAFLGEVVGR